MSRKPVPGAKMVYLIRRRAGVTRDELVMHWFANHMPGVIANQHRARGQGRMAASRYIATLFSEQSRESAESVPVWDGMAHLWFPEPLPTPRTPTGTKPRDSFQERAEPYLPWATVEYVVIDGAESLPVRPLTLNDPYPCTRSGFFKVTVLINAVPDTDYAAFFEHWLDTHASNAAEVMRRTGGLHYCISLSIDPPRAPYAGMAELYFPSRREWDAFTGALAPDGMERWIDNDKTHRLGSETEMIGIP